MVVTVGERGSTNPKISRTSYTEAPKHKGMRRARHSTQWSNSPSPSLPLGGSFEIMQNVDGEREIVRVKRFAHVIARQGTVGLYPALGRYGSFRILGRSTGILSEP